MPLINFLELYFSPLVRQPRPLKKGDLVFSVSMEPFRSGMQRWVVRQFCHAGLVAKDVADYQLGDRTEVYHMGDKRVVRDDWYDSVDGVRIDLAGVVTTLDRTTRTELVSKALAYYGRSPRPLHRSCYWMGEGDPMCHVRFPNEKEAYGFSCATFVHQCYLDIDVTLVDLDSMPLTTNEELNELILVFKNSASPTPFRRLFPSYLIGATKLDQYPFAPDDWEQWKDHGQFIPQAMLAVI
jgi:hypothetical protein